jgi:hypothetical protein
VVYTEEPKQIWTKEDDAMLRSMRQRGKWYDEISAKLGRTVSGCKKRLCKITEKQGDIDGR